MQNYDIPLHDIKPILEVQEYSLYYLIALVAVVSFLFIGAIFLFYKWMKNKNRFNLRAEHLKLLNAVNIEDTKSAAYALTLYGHTFKDDSPRHTEMYINLTERLEKYKYKKEVNSFDSEILGHIELYKGMLDV